MKNKPFNPKKFHTGPKRRQLIRTRAKMKIKKIMKDDLGVQARKSRRKLEKLNKIYVEKLNKKMISENSRYFNEYLRRAKPKQNNEKTNPVILEDFDC